ncbi:uncharacterized protein LOC141907083 [Tubulanus polymorphus]|uniref:uncharacterized protein LOC141907083 n=1 Tax=Tubulanus polymorphus TaxID=672921 RepID=UPI003DA3E895
MKSLGFGFKKRGRNSLLIEKQEIIRWQYQYLKDIPQFRKDGRIIFFLDETWVTAGHTTLSAWADTTITDHRQAFLSGLSCVLKEKICGTGRFIFLHIGNETGFIDGAQLVYRTEGALADYHGEMDGVKFEKWFEEILVPKLPPNSVIVMDNASYHSVRSEKIPTSNSLKEDMQVWLSQKGIFLVA